VFEFFWGLADGAAVVGSGDFPELGAGIGCVNGFGVTDGDIAVDLAVDQKNWNFGGGYGVLWRDLLHIEIVLPTRTQEGHFH
jgi:hypothetical protein